ncbi:MAG TPA: cobalamin-binding protein [Mucilaginibacter sp.]|jgi:ABC-type Fe3+-hydroxamate transport system substrate-binding protein|nr:cobalamin-binding protein [Mucilaginibacter sp.]
MFIYQDQLNREIVLPSTPKRIVSIVPSQTELLFDLGLTEKIVGVTKFCIHPEGKVKQVTKVGGTKQLDIEKIKSLQPDLIIANKEENERSQVEELMNICPVWISDISDLTGAIDMIERVGEMVRKTSVAKELAAEIARKFANLSIRPSGKRVAYFIWRKPYMVVGKGTFIDSMLQKCGLINAFEPERYPEINPEALLEANPDVIFLSSEPYPFKEKHTNELKAIVPNAKIKLVDGELFSWYGSRLSHAPEYFEQLINGMNR